MPDPVVAAPPIHTVATDANVRRADGVTAVEEETQNAAGRVLNQLTVNGTLSRPAREAAEPQSNLVVELRAIDAPKKLNSANTNTHPAYCELEFDGKMYDLTSYHTDGTHMHQIGHTEAEWDEKKKKYLEMLQAMKTANPNFRCTALNFHNDTKTLSFTIPAGSTEPGSGTETVLDFSKPDTIPDLYKPVQSAIDQISESLKELNKNRFFVKVINPPRPPINGHARPTPQQRDAVRPIDQPLPEKPGFFQGIKQKIAGAARGLADSLAPPPDPAAPPQA
jgi:hypothetical protein